MKASTALRPFGAVGAIAALALSGALLTPPAAGQIRRAGPTPPPPPPTAEPEARSGTPLRAEFGVPVAARLLESDESADRVRGVTRLGVIGTSEAILALVEALEQSSATARDPRARLEAVRVLAAHLKKEGVQRVLVRELTDTGAEGKGAVSSLSALLRDTAALALARSGEKKALIELVNAVLSGSGAGEAASRALQAAPPASIQPLLETRKGMSPALATLLGDLGDLRAIARLRTLMKEPEVDARIAAAVALAKLGDDAPLAVARAWATRPDPRLQRAAAEVMALLAVPDAPRVIAALLGGDATRADGIRLALSAPSPELARPLARVLPKLSDTERLRAIAALGRAGGPDAPPALVALMGEIATRPDTATAAAFALAIAPGEAARAALAAAIGRRTPAAGARLAARAGVVRALTLGEAAGGLLAVLESMGASADPSDRAVSAFGLVALGERRADAAIERACQSRAGCDGAVVAAVARAALVRGVDALAALRPLLDRGGASEPPTATRVAAGVSLLADPDAHDVPSSLLAAWAEGGGPLAPLAARALPSRDEEALRPMIKRLLEGSDPEVRAHVALGLARDPEADAVSMLAGAYRFEEDAGVRRAIVRALSRRGEAQRRAALVLARDLDPDAAVRALATSALEGRVLDLSTWTYDRTAPVAWITVLVADAPAGKAAARAGRIGVEGRLAVPVVADPDGALLVPGMPLGASSLVLAPPLPPGDAARR